MDQVLAKQYKAPFVPNFFDVKKPPNVSKKFLKMPVHSPKFERGGGGVGLVAPTPARPQTAVGKPSYFVTGFDFFRKYQWKKKSK